MNTQLAHPLSPVPSTHMFDKPVILVVEDDFSFSDLLCDMLSVKYPQFCIVSASSEQVLVLATVTRPFLLLNIRRIPPIRKPHDLDAVLKLIEEILAVSRYLFPSQSSLLCYIVTLFATQVEKGRCP
jgi:hypothetical protein